MAKSKITELTSEERDIILGSLLGDGSIGIYKNYANARFQERHSEIQRTYVYWKLLKLERLCSDKAICVQAPDGYSKLNKLKFQTLVHPALTDLYYEVSTNGQKDVSKDWLYVVNPLGLAVWWCDDGGKIGKDARRGRWNTQGFGLEGTTILRNFLEKKFKINARVLSYIDKKTNKEYYYLYLSRLQLKALLLIILPYCPTPCMLYKFFINYQDVKKQQHWIGVMKNALPQFSSEIDALANLEKLKTNEKIVSDNG